MFSTDSEDSEQVEGATERVQDSIDTVAHL
jgi:hypothetical protein